MAAIRPPSPRIKKPKKPAVSALSTHPRRGHGAPSSPAGQHHATKGVVRGPASDNSASATANAIRAGLQKAPETTSGAQMRSAAQTTYTAALRQGRQGIVNAALKLGSPEIINALKADPNFAEYIGVLDKGAADPNSQFSQSQHNESLGLEDIDKNSNAGNTYFSGLRQRDRGQLSDQYAGQRAGYLADYNTGYNDLIGAMGAAEGQYYSDLGQADAADRDAYLATNPLPLGPDTGAAPAATKPYSTTPVKGFQFVQDHGPREGMSYNIVKIGTRKYKVYANGERIPA